MICDKEQTWQKVLGEIQSKATQALLSHHTKLLFFDGDLAVIGVTRPLLKLACHKGPLIKATFESVCRRNIRVRFCAGFDLTPGTRDLVLGGMSAQPRPFDAVLGGNS